MKTENGILPPTNGRLEWLSLSNDEISQSRTVIQLLFKLGSILLYLDQDCTLTKIVNSGLKDLKRHNQAKIIFKKMVFFYSGFLIWPYDVNIYIG